MVKIPILRILFPFFPFGWYDVMRFALLVLRSSFSAQGGCSIRYALRAVRFVITAENLVYRCVFHPSDRVP
jgi:hypothetical protein